MPSPEVPEEPSVPIPEVPEVPEVPGVPLPEVPEEPSVPIPEVPEVPSAPPPPDREAVVNISPVDWFKTKLYTELPPASSIPSRYTEPVTVKLPLIVIS